MRVQFSKPMVRHLTIYASDAFGFMPRMLVLAAVTAILCASVGGDTRNVAPVSR